MNSREKILAAVKMSQPDPIGSSAMPLGVRAHADVQVPDTRDRGTERSAADIASTFIAVLESIGGAAFIIPAIGAIPTIIREQYPAAKRIVSKLPGQGGNSRGGEMPIGRTAGGEVMEMPIGRTAGGEVMAVSAGAAPGEPVDPHSFSDVDLAIIAAHFGVAENAACWITEELMTERALPFICEHLALVIDKKNIIPTMHEAYGLIGDADYGFGTFIAGPSKTADIEQSLVLGAHGPKSLIVFIIDPQISDAGFY